MIFAAAEQRRPATGITDASYGRPCVTVNVWPAIVIVPFRSLSSRFGETVYSTVSDPVPDEPRTTASQSTLTEAVHAHVAAEAVTATLPLPPLDGMDCVVGDIEKVHGGGGGADCDTVNVCPAIVIVPVRAAAVFTSTANATVPLPVPEAPLVIVTHPAFELADHTQVLAEEVTATEPDAPVSATV
jgi:hypothetical protein